MLSNKFTQLTVVLLFTVFISRIPWEKLHGAEFIDLTRYRDYFLYGQSILEYSSFSGFFDYITKEALWHYSIMFLVRGLGFSVDNVFMAISTLCIFSFSLFLVRRQGVFSLILLINPLFISLAFSQLRSALAFSLILLAYMIELRTLKFVLVLFALFIHTSVILFIFLFFLVIYFSSKIEKQKLGKLITFISLCFIGLVIAISIGPLKQIILGYLGDRRAGYGDASSSFLYTSFWLGLLLMCAFQNTNYFKDTTNCYAIVMLSIISFNFFTGGYSTRFIALTLPILMSAMLNFSGIYKYSSLFTYVAYAAFQWFYWMQNKII
jgi:EpsG family